MRSFSLYVRLKPHKREREKRGPCPYWEEEVFIYNWKNDSM
jgi:hypothetical protein